MMPADTATQAACARCGSPFHCGVNDSAPCWCSQVKLSAKMLEELEQRYRGCLCSPCLVSLQTAETS